MHQVVGFLAVGLAGAVILHSWDLPRFISIGFLLLSLGSAALVGASQTGRVAGPSKPITYSMADEMAPTESRPSRPRP